ncbi:MAG: glyoxalase [Rhodobacteraceae bacterium CG17_big_fil_post_rev_8_21_14_2_50_63_15]|nr:glyoxalase [Roseovarius sp.]PIV78055.1 MAG: glyoxalase [Rhodobacteraceae bacterium CG17_big_fil_post_rev_8_21_14_2_50_63_15]
MDFETISPAEFGATLTGLGLNLLVRDVRTEAVFLADVFGMTAHRQSADYAIMAYHGQILQLHADQTYARHPLFDLLPETPPRGTGASIHLFQSDPDRAVTRAEAMGAVILQSPTNKPHGLRECCILCDNGYAWVASRPLTSQEREAS